MKLSKSCEIQRGYFLTSLCTVCFLHQSQRSYTLAFTKPSVLCPLTLNPTRGKPSAFPRPPFGRLVSLFFRFFVNRLFATPVAKFLKLDLPLHELLILSGRVVHVFARGTAKPDEFFGEFSLCHGEKNYDLRRQKLQRTRRFVVYQILPRAKIIESLFP